MIDAFFKLESDWVKIDDALETARVWADGTWRRMTKDELIAELLRCGVQVDFETDEHHIHDWVVLETIKRLYQNYDVEIVKCSSCPEERDRRIPKYIKNGKVEYVNRRHPNDR